MRPRHWVQDLDDHWVGQDVYVVGTGPSLRVFPLEVLAGRPVIGLNMAWRTVDVDFCVTIHPGLNIPEFISGEDARPDIQWVVQDSDKVRELSREQREHAYASFYFFEGDSKDNTQPVGEPSDAGRDLGPVRRREGSRLYKWSSISQTAVNLAANMGAANVVLVGCDNTALLDDHHAHAQHTRWMGNTATHRYQQYYEGLAEVRAALRERGVNVLSLTPFVSLDRPETDYARLLDELQRPALPRPVDISDAQEPARQAQAGRAALRRVFRR